jgi:hypothetical protein
MGNNEFKQLGNDDTTHRNVPVALGFSDPVTGLALGSRFTCVSFPGDGNSKCVGNGDFGTLGNDAAVLEYEVTGTFVDVIFNTPGPTLAPTTPTTRAPSVNKCSLVSPKVTFNNCQKKIGRCKNKNLRWVGRGCRANVDGTKVLLYDGGCQCAGYCGFGCKVACEHLSFSIPYRTCFI